MTSGNFDKIAIADIVVPRETRQRRELRNIPDLADSLQRLGQINPITITREGILVTGERRYTAAKSIGWTHVTVQYVEDLDEIELRLIELEENTKRANLDWKDECEAIAAYHEAQKSINPDWTLAQTGSALGLERDAIATKIAVQEQIKQGNPLVVNADKFTVARNLTKRAAVRAKDAIVEDILFRGKERDTSIPLYNTSVENWLTSYEGPAVNFLHCDFPYGIGFDKQRGQNSANVERYDDSFATYKHLLEDVLPQLPLAPSCHLMFWFSMVHFEYTKLTLHKQGWVINPFPLIWAKSNNSGLLPDPARGGRRTYETAFAATKGDRPIVQPVAMHWHGARGEAEHASLKPRPMLQHFFRMFVDTSTVMLDPTCGSGNAVRVAKDMQAQKVMGLEVNETYYNDAVRAWGE